MSRYALAEQSFLTNNGNLEVLQIGLEEARNTPVE